MKRSAKSARKRKGLLVQSTGGKRFDAAEAVQSMREQRLVWLARTANR